MKLTPLYLILVVTASLVLQTRISILGIKPALTMAVVYYIGLTGGAAKGILAGCLIGVVEDSVVGGIIGPNLLGKGMAGFLASFIPRGIFRWTPVLGVLAIATLTILDGFTVFLSRAVYETLPAPPSSGIAIIMIQGLLNTPLGLFLKPGNAE